MYKKLILLLFGAAFCFTSASAQTNSTWQLLKSPKGKFSVNMPCKPEVETQPKDANGPEITFHSCNGTHGNFVVTYADFDLLEGTKETLDAYVEGVVGDSTVVSERAILLGKIPGRELVVSVHKDGLTLIYKWRIYLSGKRIYAITVASPKPVPGEADTSKFMSSFAIQ